VAFAFCEWVRQKLNASTVSATSSHQRKYFLTMLHHVAWSCRSLATIEIKGENFATYAT
jgi:hypothetical protein